MFPVWYRPLLHQGGLRRVLPGGAGGRALPAGESQRAKFSQNSRNFVDSITAPTAVWPQIIQKMILSVTKKFVCTIVCCDQYASSWNVRQNIIGRGSQLTSSSRSRDAVAQCKWHSGVIQSPASLQFPYKFQARSDRKVTTSLAWLGSS